MSPPPLVLASGSPYRRQLLTRLGLVFEVLASAIDETAGPEEPAAALVRRLARAKAAAAAARRPGAVIIGSDQIACRGAETLGKPADATAARAQLRGHAGHEVAFLTAVCVHGPGATADEHLDVTRVLFRALGTAEIERYVAAEAPLDCAGSFKCEGLGISLFERVVSSDPTALIGLPLIFVAQALRARGYAVP